VVRQLAKLVIALAVAALGVAAAIYADADDAPGGVLLGMLLIIGAVVFGIRTVQRGE
jgi:uncharacterized membrane protein YedE/YeeE